MNLAGYTLPDVVLFPAAGIAAGSFVLPIVGLVTVWMLRRRALPLRHALLLGTLGVLAMLPALIPWLESRGLGWKILPESPDSPRSVAPLTATYRPSTDDSMALELPTNGSLDAEGMTVAEVMARYEKSAGPAIATPATPMFASEAAFDVSRLILPAGSCLCLIWLVGSGCSLCRALRAGRTLRRLTRRSAPIDEPQLVELLARCVRDAGVG